METSWIQVFVLILSECVAPSGKAVCQEQESRYQFADRAACDAMLEELMAYKSRDPNVIVNSARCLPTAVERPAFASLDEANEALADSPDWGILPPGEAERQEPMPEEIRESMSEHQQRLESLPECDESETVTPCKVGQIIVESEEKRDLEIWRRAE